MCNDKNSANEKNEQSFGESEDIGMSNEPWTMNHEPW